MALTTPALLESWQLALHNKRPRTVTLYLDEMRRLADWLEAHDRPAGQPGSLLDVTRDDARAWINDMQAQGLSPNTIRNRWVAARSLYRWLVDEDELDESPFAKVTVDKPDIPPPNMLTDDELRALLAACAGKAFLDKRDYALIRFMLATGLRRAEVCAVRTEDINFASRVVVIPDGKGGKYRAVRFDPATAAALDRYRRARARHTFAGLPWFWVTHQGRLTVKGLPTILTKRAGIAGLTGVHPHALRHSWAHRLKLAGMSDENVRQLGGWESSEVMRRYGQALAADRALAAYDVNNPFAAL